MPHGVQPGFAKSERLLPMIDEMARRYGTMPGRLLAPLDAHPVEVLWLDLIIGRACAESAVGTREQFIKRNRDSGSLRYSVPIPGA